MAITAPSSTTLSSAITKTQTRFAVASTSGINGLGSLTSPQSVLVIGGEAMLVLNVPMSGVVEVTRGVNGTKPVAYASGTTVYFGAKTVFSFAEDGQVGLAGEAGADTAGGLGSLPNYRLPAGSRKRDFMGNEYVMCSLSGTVFKGTPVQISNAYAATVIGATGRGAFGVMAEPGVSGQFAWVQIYGTTMVQLLGATAGVSPSDAANGPTTLSTTAQTKFWLPTTATSTGPEGLRWTSGTVSTTSGFYIEGVTVAQDAAPGAVTAVTAATSHTGEQISVFLNYPRIVHMNYGE